MYALMMISSECSLCAPWSLRVAANVDVKKNTFTTIIYLSDIISLDVDGLADRTLAHKQGLGEL